MNHRLLALTAAAVAALAFAAPAAAQTYTFAATLTGAAEAPPVATTAGGSALVTFNTQASSVSVAEWFFGLTAPLSDNHIHCCTTTPLAGTSGVAVNFTGAPTVTTGSYFNTFTLSSSAYSSLLNGSLAGKSYVNVHSSAFPSGEIRGFLQLVAFAPVPEPSTYALMLGGVAICLAAKRRRQA